MALKVSLGRTTRRPRPASSAKSTPWAGVDHPNLVKIFTSGFDEEPCFFTMELVEGAPWDAVCERLQSRSTSAAVIDLDAWASC